MRPDAYSFAVADLAAAARPGCRAIGVGQATRSRACSVRARAAVAAGKTAGGTYVPVHHAPAAATARALNSAVAALRAIRAGQPQRLAKGRRGSSGRAAGAADAHHHATRASPSRASARPANARPSGRAARSAVSDHSASAPGVGAPAHSGAAARSAVSDHSAGTPASCDPARAAAATRRAALSSGAGSTRLRSAAAAGSNFEQPHQDHDGNRTPEARGRRPTLCRPRFHALISYYAATDRCPKLRSTSERAG